MDPFHLALPVHDLAATRAFYGGVLGCREGRSAPTWIDFDFFGHQISLHLAPEGSRVAHTSPVDGHGVPIPHFGIVLDLERWDELAGRLRAAGVKFVIEPTVRFRGQVGEQVTMFFSDPSGNALEFKAFGRREALFER